MTNRDIDMRAEQELAAFLDAHFYQELLQEGKFLSFQRIGDIKLQKKGVDIVGKTAAREAYIDEKAQLHYMADPLPTFAFELSFLLRGAEITGWFLNDALKTTHYFLLWPRARVSDPKVFKSTDLTEVEGLMLPKAALKTYLAGLGLDDRILRDKARELRKLGKPGPHPSGCDKITYHLSPAYAEAPINIVIRKEHLLSIPGAVHYLISPSGSVRI